MPDGEKDSVASTGLEIKRSTVAADEESAVVVDDPVRMGELNEGIMGAIESVAERVGPKGDIRIVGRMRQTGAKIIPFRRSSGGDVA
ncbi:MAG: hypothetical protein M1444_04180 [Patescibacteria group bacterium]|nr:hypothetical protein [Patescibacteria group bacterium]